MILFAVHFLLCPAFLPFFPHICKWMKFHEPGKPLKTSASYQGCQTFKSTSCEVVEMIGWAHLVLTDPQILRILLWQRTPLSKELLLALYYKFISYRAFKHQTCSRVRTIATSRLWNSRRFPGVFQGINKKIQDPKVVNFTKQVTYKKKTAQKSIFLILRFIDKFKEFSGSWRQNRISKEFSRVLEENFKTPGVFQEFR